MRYVYLLILSFILITANCFAKEYGDIICGAYPISIYDFDFTHNNFKTTFYFWALSKTGYDAGKNVEIANATEYKVNFSDVDKVPGFDRNTVRYTATVMTDWDLTYFPFDRQTLVVNMEDSVYAEDQVRLIADEKNSSLARSFLADEWELKKFELKTDTHLYDTNFGDPSVKNSKFSRLKLIFHVKRFGESLYIGLFIGFFIAFFLCMISYISPIEEIGFRGSLMLGAIFATIGNKYVIEQSIPPNTYVLLFDAFQVITFMVIIYTLFVIIFCHKFYNSGKQEKAIFLNKISVAGSSVFYITSAFVFTYIAVVS